MRRIGLSALALVCTGALAACGGSSSGGGGDNGAGNTQPSSTTAAGDFDKTAAAQQAQASLLTSADLPDGWTTSPSQDTEADTVVQGKLADCLGVDASFFDKEGPDKVEAKTDDFNSPGGGQSSVGETVAVETASRTTSDFAVVNSSKLPGCFETVYGAFLKEEFAKDPSTKDVTIGDVTAQRADIPAYGDESAGFEITVPLSGEGQSTTVVIDMVFVRSGNATAQLVFRSLGGPFDTETAASITSKAADKLSQAAA